MVKTPSGNSKYIIIYVDWLNEGKYLLVAETQLSNGLTDFYSFQPDNHAYHHLLKEWFNQANQNAQVVFPVERILCFQDNEKKKVFEIYAL